MSKIQKQNEENAKRAYRTEILLVNSKKLRRAKTRQQVSDELAGQIQKLMQFTVLIYMKKHGVIQVPSVYLRSGIEEEEEEILRAGYTSRSEQAVVKWVFENGHRAGCTTHTLPNAKAIYLPVMEDDKVSAVSAWCLRRKERLLYLNTISYLPCWMKQPLYWSGSRRWRIWQSPQQITPQAGYGYHLRVYHL